MVFRSSSVMKNLGEGKEVKEEMKSQENHAVKVKRSLYSDITRMRKKP